MASNVWETWPLDEYREFYSNAIAFIVPSGSALPAKAVKAITECWNGGRDVLIVWTYPRFAVVEAIEPIEEDDEKEDLRKKGIDWRTRGAQSFDVVVSYEFDEPDSDIVQEWLDNLCEIGTKTAVKDFHQLPDLALYVYDGMRSPTPAGVVYFGVGGINRAQTDENRTQVLAWVERVFAPLLISASARAPGATYAGQPANFIESRKIKHHDKELDLQLFGLPDGYQVIAFWEGQHVRPSYSASFVIHVVELNKGNDGIIEHLFQQAESDVKYWLYLNR